MEIVFGPGLERMEAENLKLVLTVLRERIATLRMFLSSFEGDHTVIEAILEKGKFLVREVENARE